MARVLPTFLTLSGEIKFFQEKLMYGQDFQITFRTLIWGLGAMPPDKFCQNQCNLGVRVTPRFHHGGGGLVVLENTVIGVFATQYYKRNV